MLRVLTFSTLYPNAAQPGFGGFVERQTLRLAARDDVELRVVAPLGVPPWPLGGGDPRRGLPERELWQGVETHRPRFTAVPRIGWRWNPAQIAAAAHPVLARMRADGFAFDVIDAEFFYPCGVAAVRLGRRFGVPVSIKSRGSDISLWADYAPAREMILAAARDAAGLLAVSAAQRDLMASIGIAPERVRVHYTGVDLDRFQPADRADARAALALPAGPLVVSVGNLVALKGHDIVIDAVASLPGVSLAIAGDGPERAALAARIAASGAADRIRLLGSLPHDRMPALLAAADVMALASEREGLANVWVESLACGTPVVAPDIGSIREVLDRPAAGRVAAARTPAAIAEAVAGLIADPPPPAAVRAAAERFAWAHNTGALFDHLSACAASA